MRFDVLAAASAEVDLIKHIPESWPDSIQDAITSLASHRFQLTQSDTASALTAEVDLKAIGSASVANNRTYEEWEPHLTESQREVLKHPIDSSIRIIGPAGSGKTLALCMRAIQISRDPDVGAKGKRILLATHSWAMAERIDGVLRVLNGGLRLLVSRLSLSYLCWNYMQGISANSVRMLLGTIRVMGGQSRLILLKASLRRLTRKAALEYQIGSPTDCKRRMRVDPAWNWLLICMMRLQVS